MDAIEKRRMLTRKFYMLGASDQKKLTLKSLTNGYAKTLR